MVHRRDSDFRWTVQRCPVLADPVRNIPSRLASTALKKLALQVWERIHCGSPYVSPHTSQLPTGQDMLPQFLPFLSSHSNTLQGMEASVCQHSESFLFFPPKPCCVWEKFYFTKDFPGGAGSKEPAYQRRLDMRDAASIRGSGRSPGEGNGTPLQYSCLEHLMDRGAWRATVHGVTKSRTCLKWFSTHARYLYLLFQHWWL